ncbi:hypothetical protein CTRI78_v000533 [Colletotrichum trifolii]|uniref:Uncharacterized protein n=1 Tax=Colletotrichum trifolii TaxID=5466 RepID=A0A4R8RRZ8_COLTR|nr:hypothetical protein CTRI78_v000533 [Colletotrichum trifolii]
MANLSGAERIRAITDEDGMFKAFDTYPWTKDNMFLSGLAAILGDPNTVNPQGTPADLATHARIFYYASRIGVTIDFNRYKDWVARHPDHTPPNVLPEEYESQAPAPPGEPSSSSSSRNDVPDLTSKLDSLDTADSNITAPADTAETDRPSWQSSAPAADLYVERKTSPQPAVGTPDAGGEPAYPVGFAEMLQMLQKGIPIPGIKQIPDTVVRDASVKPFGKRQVPRKPWEKELPADAEQAEKPAVVDAEFPPLDDTETPEAGKVSAEK